MGAPIASTCGRSSTPVCSTARRGSSVVIDASNGMAGTMVPKVFGDVPGLEICR